ncbi:MAG: zinc ABC transporter substrate-binding protein [Pirellulales bacterium]
MPFSASFLRLGLCILSATVLFGCGGPAGPRTGKPQIVCTTGQVADMVQAIAGDQVEVKTLIGPGVDPHSYRASSPDAAALRSADAVFYSGLHLEGRLSEQLEKLAVGKPTLGLGDAIADAAPDRIRRVSGAADPHIWFDAEVWSLSIPAVVEKLSALKPDFKAAFEQAGAKYRDQLLAAHADCKNSIGELPETARLLVTAHDAFEYYGAAYGLEVRGLQGISTVDETSLEEVNRLVELLVDRKVKAVFVESSVPKERLRQVIDGCAARGHSVVVGGELYSDAMGEPGTPAGTYVGMLRYNTQTIVAALK